MNYLIPRILNVLSVVAIVSFLPSAFALGGLTGGLVDTVEDALVVDETNDGETEQTEVEPLEETVVEEDQDVAINVDDGIHNLDGEDKYVRVENELLESAADRAGVGQVGDVAYTVQEDVVHGSITKLTGTSVDHFYAWVCIGNTCIPVDPFTVNN